MAVLNNLLTLYNPLMSLSINQFTIYISMYRPNLMLEEYVNITSSGHGDPKIFNFNLIIDFHADPEYFLN